MTSDTNQEDTDDQCKHCGKTLGAGYICDDCEP